MEIKILQFGEGNFLRCFTDWMVQRMNDRCGFDGQVQIIQPRGEELNAVSQILNARGGKYHTCLRGIIDGRQVEELEEIGSVKGVDVWTNLEKYAEMPFLRFVFSNTTEAAERYHRELGERDEALVCGEPFHFLAIETPAGTKYYTGVFTTTEAIASAVPTLADAAVAIPDAASGTVEASAFVAWGGEKSAKCELVLKYGKVSGVYTKERVISTADIGTVYGTGLIKAGDRYAVLVARSSEGESAVSQEFELYSTKPRKSTVFYLK